MTTSRNYVLNFLAAIPLNSKIKNGVKNTTISNIIFDSGTFHDQYTALYAKFSSGENVECLRAIHNSLANTILPNHKYIQKAHSTPIAESSMFFQLATEKAWIAATESLSQSVSIPHSNQFKALLAEMGDKNGYYPLLTFASCTFFLKQAYIKLVRSEVFDSHTLYSVKDEYLVHYFCAYSFFEAIFASGFEVKSLNSKNLGKEYKKVNRSTLSGVMKYLTRNNLGKVQVQLEKNGITHVFAVDLRTRVKANQLVISPADVELMELSIASREFADLLVAPVVNLEA